MSKQVHAIKVRDLPPIDSLAELGVADRKKFGLILPGGGINDYRVYMMKGQGASRKDSTFDKEQGVHTCCGSRVAWRHKVACHLLIWDDAKLTPKDGEGNE